MQGAWSSAHTSNAKPIFLGISLPSGANNTAQEIPVHIHEIPVGQFSLRGRACDCRMWVLRGSPGGLNGGRPHV